jgi:hypothetical protein
MKKVYFEVASKSWLIDDLDEIYSIKYIDIMTNEENTGILTWLKGIDHTEVGIGEEDRLYVTPGMILIPLVRAVQELSAQVNDLKLQVAALQSPT